MNAIETLKKEWAEMTEQLLRCEMIDFVVKHK